MGIGGVGGTALSALLGIGTGAAQTTSEPDSLGTAFDTIVSHGEYPIYPASVMDPADDGYAIAGNANTNLTLSTIDDRGTEQWTKVYDLDKRARLYDAIALRSGGYVLAGRLTERETLPTMVVVKSDSEGNEVFTREYARDGFFYPRAVVEAPDRGYVLAGDFGPRGDINGFALKLDTDGTEEWFQEYEQGQIRDLAQLNNRNLVLAENSGTLIITDDEGNVETATEQEFRLRGVCSSRGQGYATTGPDKTYVPWAEIDVALDPTDPRGNSHGITTYGGDNYEDPTAVIHTDDDGYAIAGATRSFSEQTSADLRSANDYLLVKTDSEGDQELLTAFGGTGLYGDQAVDLIQAEDGGFVLVGLSSSFGPGTGFNCWVVKTEPIA